jgi:hypothetical protein
MDDLPFLEELNNMTQENNKKQNIQYQINTSSDKKENNANSNKENDIIVNNTIELDENKEEAKANDLNEEKNKELTDTENKEPSNHNHDSLLGQKTKPSNEILDNAKIPIIDNNTSNTNNNTNNESAKEYPSISAYNDENKKNEEYDFGYSIILMNDGESGLMEDFFKEKQNESTTSDYFNYHLDEDKWIKIFNHSILLHYERHINELKAENEKKKKMQSMFNNTNNTGNPQMMTQMNPMMFMNMGNGVNYPAQMYYKNIPMQHNYPK